MKSFREIAEEICKCRRELEKISHEQSNLIDPKVKEETNKLNEAIKKFEYFMMEHE